MYVLVHDYTGHPFQVQLSRYLARKGHRVTHAYSAFFQTPHGLLNLREDDPSDLEITGVKSGESFDKHNFIRRAFQERAYGTTLARLIDERRPDAVISANNPTDSQAQVLRACRRLKIPTVHWLQDVYSVAIHRILRRKLPVIGSLIGWRYMNLERKLLQGANHIVSITADFTPLLNKWGVDESRITTIPNWSPLEEIPLRSKDNPWSRDKGIQDSFVFLYAGTLGMKHNPDLLFSLAKRFQGRAQVVVNSEGLGATWLMEQLEKENLDNLRLFGFQPWEMMPDILGSADVLVTVLEPDAGVFSVPSKVLSYLCAGRAQLLAVSSENLVARIIDENMAGLTSHPNDKDTFISNAEKLYNDPEMRERMGRAARSYAEATFDIEKIGKRFEQILDRIVNKKPAKAG